MEDQNSPTQPLSFTSWRMVAAYMGIILLLPTGVLSAALVAQITPETARALEAAEELAGKPLGYWLIGLAGFCGTTFTLIVKWLLAQLESQRTANAAASAQLIEYLREDRALLVKQLTENTTAVTENSKIIEAATKRT
jgi:hypothetical protein